MLELQAAATPGGLAALPPGAAYASWEASRAFGCACDRGFTGADCSVRICPHGDSPYSLSQQRKAVVVRVNTGGAAALEAARVRFFFNGATSDAIDLATLTAGNCLARFSIAGSDVALGLDAAASACRVARAGDVSAANGMPLRVGALEIALALAFSSSAVSSQSNIFAHDGDPPPAAFGCVADAALPAALAGSIFCEVAPLDVRALALRPDPVTGAPAALGAAVSYSLVVSDDGAFPATFVATRVEAGSPPVVTTFPEQVMSVGAAVAVGPAADGLFVTFGALWAHTRNAAWRVDVAVDALSAERTVRVAAPSFREHAVCGGAGTCDGKTGVCACAAGGAGPACNSASAYALSSRTAPILTVVALAADYAGAVLAVSSQRALGSADFDYLTVAGGGAEPFFRLRGDGLLSGASAAFSAGVDVDGGLVAGVSAGAAPFAHGAAPLSVWYGSTDTPPAGGVAVVASDFPRDDARAAATTAFAVSARATAGAAAPGAAHAELLAVGGDGAVRANYGLTVGGSGRGGLALQGDAGLAVATGGVSVGAGDLTLARGALNVTGNSSHYGTLHVYGDIILQNGTINLLGPKSPTGVVINDRLIVVNDATFKGLVTAEQGLDVLAGGIVVRAGGLDIANGGIVVDTGGISVFSGGGIFSNGGLSVTGIDGFLAASSADVPNALSKVLLAPAGGPVASFYTGESGAYAGDVVHVQGPSPLGSPLYNLLRLATRAGAADTGNALRVSAAGDVFSTDDLIIGTEGSSVSVSGSVSIVAGASTANPSSAGGYDGGDALLEAGASRFGDGGDARLLAGASAGAGEAGGHAYVLGGAATGAGGFGGHVFLRPGAGDTPGNVRVQDAAGVDRVTVTGNGDILLSPATGTVTSITSSAPIVTTATYLSMQASVAALLLGASTTDGSNAGAVSIVGGSAAASAPAGGVAIVPGQASTGANGDVRIFSASASAVRLRVAVTDEATTVWSADAPALTVRHDAAAAASDVTIAGGLTAAGSVTVASAAGARLAVAGALAVAGDADFAATLRVTTGLEVTTGGLYVAGATSLAAPTIFGAGVVVGGDASLLGALNVGAAVSLQSLGVAGPATVGGLAALQGGAAVGGPLTVSGAATVALGLTAASATVANDATVGGVLAVTGDLTVGGRAFLLGDVLFPGSVAVEGSVSLATGSALLGTSTTLSFTGTDSAAFVGGQLSVGGTAALAGGAVVTGGLTVAAGGAAVVGDSQVAGALTVTGGATVGGGAAVAGTAAVGALVVTGAATLNGGAAFFGAASFGSGDGSPVLGAPLLLRGVPVVAPGPAWGVSVVGGAALDGDGGTVVLQGGQKGGDNYVGAVVIADAFGAEMLRAEVGGVFVDAGAGALSVAPALLVAGTLSVTGAASLLGDAFVGGRTLGAGDATWAGAAGAASFVQAGTGGTLSYQGTLAGSGWLDPQMLTPCDAAGWAIGGICYGLFSEAPGTANSRVALFWNFDTVAHDVLYGADAQVYVPVAPGATFPVYVQGARRRRIADLPALRARRRE